MGVRACVLVFIGLALVACEESLPTPDRGIADEAQESERRQRETLEEEPIRAGFIPASSTDPAGQDTVRLEIELRPNEDGAASGVVGAIGVGQRFDLLTLTDAPDWEVWEWNRFDHAERSYPGDLTSPVLMVRAGGQLIVCTAVSGVGREVRFELTRGRSGIVADVVAGEIVLTAEVGRAFAPEAEARSAEDVRVVVETFEDFGEVDWNRALRTYTQAFRATVPSTLQGMTTAARATAGGPWLFLPMAIASRVTPSNRRGWLLLDDPAEVWRVAGERARFLQPQRDGVIIFEHPAGLHFLRRDLSPPFCIGTGLGPDARRTLLELSESRSVGVLWDGCLSPTVSFDGSELRTDSLAELVEAMSSELDALVALGVRHVLFDDASATPPRWLAVVDALVARFPQICFSVRGPVPDVLRARIDVWLEPEFTMVGAGTGEDVTERKAVRRDEAGAVLTPGSRVVVLERLADRLERSAADLARRVKQRERLGVIPLVESDTPIKDE